MKAISKILAGGVGVIALAGAAAPAAAQGYPGYGYGGGDVLGAIINSVLGQNRGYGGYRYGYDPNRERYLVDQCARATQVRIQRNYGQAGYNPYGGYGGYGGGYGYGNAYSAARIVGISRVDRRSNGGLKIWGTATSGRGYGGGYGYNAAADLRFDCTINYRGRITDIDVSRNTYGYGRYRGY